MRSPALLALALAAVSGCEPRFDEPAPSPRSAAPASPPAATASAPAAPPAKKRCIRATPATPERPAPASAAPDPSCPADPAAAPPKLREGRVVFADAGKKAVSVEIAEREDDRMRGLMYRRALAEDRGMIFRFEEARDHSFWMHNTCIPLDMLFIADDGTIAGIEENTRTMDDSTYGVGCPSSYVLELNAGWARKHGVAAGQRVVLEGI
jgi:uncharacterized membrane protein (UPF0127 family)